MLPYNAYYQTLAAIGDRTNPEWQTTTAGLVVLRLVNDWLDFGADVIPSRSANFAAAKALIARIPHEKGIKSLLAQVVRSLELAEQTSLAIVAPNILAYAEALTHNEQFSLAENALASFLQRALRHGDTETIISLSLQQAYALRSSGDLAMATEHYHTAKHYARTINDRASILKAHCGEAKVISEQGDLSLSDTMTADAVKTAESIGDQYLLSTVLHARAYDVINRGDYRTGKRFLQQALPFSEETREYVLGDIASTLSGSGRFEESRRKSLLLAATAQTPTVRLQSVINLMYIAYEERDEYTFDLHRTALEFAPLKPWFAIGFRKFSAEGLRTFGREVEADSEIQKARAIAIKHHIHTLHAEEEQNFAQEL